MQAKPYIFIDDAVINKAIEFLMTQQNVNGTFNEPGRVLHKAMQVLAKKFSKVKIFPILDSLFKSKGMYVRNFLLI